MGEAGEEVVGDEGKKRRGKRPLVIGLGAMLLLAVLGGAGFFLTSGHSAKAARGPDAVPVIVDVPDIISNLDTGGHRASFVKVHAKIEVADADAAKQIGAGMPRVLDLFQTYLRSMRPDELKGGEGMYRLREALIYRLDGMFAPIQVRDVLFTELLVQ